MPHTHLGRISCRLGILSLTFFAAFFALVAAGQRGGDTFFSNPWLASTMLAAGASAIAAAAAGLAAVIRQSERALSVVATIAFGAVVLAFALGEILFPH